MSTERSPEQSDYDLADYFVADLDSRLEGAYMSRDDALKEHLRVMLERAMGLRSRLWDRLQATQPRSFEDILRDPTSQMDKDGVVLASILDYGSRKVCGATIEVRSNTAGGIPAVIPPSRYICTKPTPCTDHSVTGGSTPETIKAPATSAPSLEKSPGDFKSGGAR